MKQFLPFCLKNAYHLADSMRLSKAERGHFVIINLKLIKTSYNEL